MGVADDRPGGSMSNKNLLFGIMVACAVAMLVVNAPDIKRYIRISTM
jgi:hypothetical protein